MSLTARHLEANGISTVVIGSGRDIVEQCGVTRFVFTDFPLGNPCGKPYDVAMQSQIMEIAFDILENTRYPRTTIQAPFQWGDSTDWRRSYMEIAAA